jgi:hypothetical protein
VKWLPKNLKPELKYLIFKNIKTDEEIKKLTTDENLSEANKALLIISKG